MTKKTGCNCEMRGAYKAQSKTGSARTVVVAVVALLAGAFSIANLMRHRDARVNPRDHIEFGFLCRSCEHVTDMKLTEMHALLWAGDDSVVMDAGNPQVRCGRCGDWSDPAMSCPGCGRSVISPATEADKHCHHCGTDLIESSSRQAERPQ